MSDILAIKDALFRMIQQNDQSGLDSLVPEKLEKLRHLPRVMIGLVIYDNIGLEQDLADFWPDRFRFVAVNDINDPRLNICDIILIHSPHSTATDRDAFIERMMLLRRTALVGMWLWDHHHMIPHSALMSRVADIVFATHGESADYLHFFTPYAFSIIPAASYQWGNVSQNRELFEKHGHINRLDQVYGGFRQYEGFRRNHLLDHYMELLDDHAITNVPYISSDDNNHYYRLDLDGRFREWCTYKLSISASISHDIPIRVFDALVTGQIPLVPLDNTGMYNFVAGAAGTDLPIMFYSPHNDADFLRACRMGLEKFNDEGLDGVITRHEYALNHHMMHHRVRDMMRFLHNLVQWKNDGA